MKKTRDTWVEIDLDNVAHNYNFFKEKTNKEVFGVVKANAYGHGDVEVAKTLQDLGIKVLCVSSLDEALHLKESGITCDILIFSYTNPKDVKAYKDPQFIFTIPSLEWFNEIIEEDIRLHLEIDTGMNRMGVKDILEAKMILSGGKPIEGLYTHFSSADDNLEETKRQLALFKYIHGVLDYDFKWVHSGNTHGSLAVEDAIINANRIGLGLYGYGHESLRPVLNWYSKVIHVAPLYKGESVGYNRQYISNEDGHVATLPIGYADGFDVRNRGLDVFINDKPYAIVGKICMDQMMVLVDDSIKVGDVVELIGPNRTAQDVADHLGVIVYNVFTSISYRVNKKTAL